MRRAASNDLQTQMKISSGLAAGRWIASLCLAVDVPLDSHYGEQMTGNISALYPAVHIWDFRTVRRLSHLPCSKFLLVPLGRFSRRGMLQLRDCSLMSHCSLCPWLRLSRYWKQLLAYAHLARPWLPCSCCCLAQRCTLTFSSAPSNSQTEICFGCANGRTWLVLRFQLVTVRGKCHSLGGQVMQSSYEASLLKISHHWWLYTFLLHKVNVKVQNVIFWYFRGLLWSHGVKHGSCVHLVYNTSTLCDHPWCCNALYNFLNISSSLYCVCLQ